jgi:hypothetical protein
MRTFNALICMLFLCLMNVRPAAAASSELLAGFTPNAGTWRMEAEGGINVLVVDGSRHTVSRTEHFPLAIYSAMTDFRHGTISVRFKPMAGKSDQAGGIVFDRQANGDYLVLRANALEGNLNLYRYAAGRRSPLREAGDAPAPAGVWHELKLVVSGRTVQGYLDGVLLLEHDLGRGVSGGIGLWSKDDSVTLFKDFNVTAGEHE